ncbi:peptidoglycan recognition protein family protein [Metabacillus sp. Hm71]|uniref:peptidoglycan recognition protein family protein n=1 Tax=Metabacillus sp. Hm71 TaxID=3450743 RepID=UPI003F441805
MITINKDFIPVGSSNRPGTIINPKYITIHNTANKKPGANALMHATYLKGSDAREREVSWHYTVDDKHIIQHLPVGVGITEKGWHAGSGNSVSIGIEICEHEGIHFDKAVINAQKLIVHLMSELNIPADNVVPHKKWTGKDCPHVILHEWGGFPKFVSQIKQLANNPVTI